jgi:hypothetical protein
MKNIYLLPTDKPSRLFEILNFNYIFDSQNKYSDEYKKLHKWRSKHIYITSDEEIKEGEWFITTGGYLHRCHTKNSKTIYYVTNSGGIAIGAEYCKKVILTTDEDLIVSGVQAIDNTFAEWFVKNPSCEWVEVEIKPMFPMYSTFIESIDNPPFYGNLERKIIILQEEPKQETLEEAALNYSIYNEQANKAIQEAVKFGAKWMKERMYSEENMLAFLDWSKSTNKEKSEYELKCLLNGKDIDSKKLFIMWFEQFKKK